MNQRAKIKQEKKDVDFLHSFSIGVVDGLFDVGTIHQLSALQAHDTVGCITGLSDASPDIIELDHHDHPKRQTDLGAALFNPHSGHPGDCGASTMTGCQTPN